MRRLFCSFWILLPLVASAINHPTMGWSSWNTFAINISDTLIMAQADACVVQGLKDAGYTYINIDDGYFGGRDQSTGTLLTHPTRFPKGMKPVVDYIHNLGLKAGIYSDAGTNTCGHYYSGDTIAHGVGLLGHEEQDADLFFNQWGFDFIKVDFCGCRPTSNTDRIDMEPRERYEAIAQAIAQTGRDDVKLNVCRWRFPGTWVRDIALSWRTTSDIRCRWTSVRNIIEKNLYLSAYCGDGHYNDMDMLEVGRTLTQTEDQTHFGMWCMLSSPLLIGCDLRDIKLQTLQLLKNKELIALNQDPLGLQAYVVKHVDSTYVLVKDIEQYQGLTRAVALYNPSDSACEISFDFADIDLSGSIQLRDLFLHQDIQVKKGMSSFSTLVPAHGCAIYRVKAGERLERTRYEAETAYLTSYQDLYDPQVVGTAYYQRDSLCSGGMKVVNLGFRPSNDIVWNNVYAQQSGERTIRIRVLNVKKNCPVYVQINNQEATKFTDVDMGQGWIIYKANLRQGDNIVRLSSYNKSMPEVDYLEIAE